MRARICSLVCEQLRECWSNCKIALQKKKCKCKSKHYNTPLPNQSSKLRDLSVPRTWRTSGVEFALQNKFRLNGQQENQRILENAGDRQLSMCGHTCLKRMKRLHKQSRCTKLWWMRCGILRLMSSATKRKTSNKTNDHQSFIWTRRGSQQKKSSAFDWLE